MFFYSKFVFEAPSPEVRPLENQPQTVSPEVVPAQPSDPRVSGKIETLGARVQIAEVKSEIGAADKPLVVAPNQPMAQPTVAPNQPLVQPTVPPPLSEEAQNDAAFEAFKKGDGQMLVSLYPDEEGLKAAFTGTDGVGATVLSFFGFGAAKDKIKSWFDKSPKLSEFFSSTQNFFKDMFAKLTGGVLDEKKTPTNQDAKAFVSLGENVKPFENAILLTEEVTLKHRLVGKFTFPNAMRVNLGKDASGNDQYKDVEPGKEYELSFAAGMKLPINTTVGEKSHFVLEAVPEKPSTGQA